MWGQRKIHFERKQNTSVLGNEELRDRPFKMCKIWVGGEEDGYSV